MKLSFSTPPQVALEMVTCYDWEKTGLENTIRYVNQKN